MDRKSLMAVSKRVSLLLIALAAIFSAGTLAAAASSANYFLKVDGILGESVDPRHNGEIDLLNFTMTFSGASVCGNLQVSKYIDRSSPAFVLNAILGRRFSQTVLSAESISAENALDFFFLRLSNVRVLSVTVSDTSGTPPAVEQVTLAADRIVLEYRQFLPTGSLGPALVTTVDCLARTAR